MYRNDREGRRQPTVAVLIPCYNEEITIGDVVRQFRAQLPDALIYVFDNNSSDRTAQAAREAGASVYFERRQGKGHVVRKMFREVEADFYIMVDGDATYPASIVAELLAPVLKGEAEMVIGSRLHPASESEFRRRNLLGNRLFATIFNAFFRAGLTDILSGYRAFNRKFVKSIPLTARGFEIETELTCKAVEYGYRIAEVPISLRDRPAGSYSKGNLLIHGPINLLTMVALFRDFRPLKFFGIIGLALVAAGAAPGLFSLMEVVRDGRMIHSLPPLLATALVLPGMCSMMVGLVLHTLAQRLRGVEYRIQAMADELSYQMERRAGQIEEVRK
jgi:glycosyltransferase involved in cell wall biosynthesis